jgi:hypothetical protein
MLQLIQIKTQYFPTEPVTHDIILFLIKMDNSTIMIGQIVVIQCDNYKCYIYCQMYAALRRLYAE